MNVSNHLQRLRQLMADRGYDAMIVRNNPDLRWLTGARRVLDDEVAHTALITQNGAWLHTDSRYYNAFVDAIGQDAPWRLDMDVTSHELWVAQQLEQAKAWRVGVEDTLTLGFFRKLERAIEDAALPCTLAMAHGDLVEMRAVKDADEIAQMRAAQAVTDEAFSHMCGVIRPGVTEMQLRAELDNYMLTHGADTLSFATIVASGPNTANPHAQPGQREVQKGDFVLMDYGAGLGDYRSDMTRTVVVGQPTDRQLEIYNLVRSTHEACAAMIRPGVLGSDVHALATRLITEAGYGDCFKHGLGHGVGIEIHEQPMLNRADRHHLVPGNVVTVEPGVYIPGFGGVRLEDYGVVTQDGFEPFTASTHELVVIEA